MNLRCKVFRASKAEDLEASINHFFSEELTGLGAVQFEEITQSEGAAGVTVVVWYTLIDEADEILGDETELEAYDEVDGKELA